MEFHLSIAAFWITFQLFHTGRFIRPRSRIFLRFLPYVAISALLSQVLDHWALIYIFAHPLVSLALHTRRCLRHGIHPVTCEPESAYRSLISTGAPTPGP